ncbi:MAG: EpsD family peptidyl-prolyl cis-trans isomerase, partial [Betaproteobacteria bacterium]
CDRGDGAMSPIAAKVNNAEILVAQISSMLARGGLSDEELKKSRPQALESLIDQQLLVQKALEDKLDRETQTAQALAAARKQVLAQAYMDKAMSAVVKPTPAQIQAFYDKNPMLFAQRRIYRFQEFGAAVPDERFDEVNRIAQKAKTLAEIGAWLKAQNIPFKAIDSTKAAEEMPMELLPNLAKMNDGQIAVLRAPGRVAILQLAQSQQAPLDVQHATLQIEQYLMNAGRLEIAKAEVRKLRDAAQIEYLGEFGLTRPVVADKGQLPAK